MSSTNAISRERSYAIFDRQSVDEHSKFFTIPKGASQLTLTAFDLSDDDCLHIHMVALGSGEPASICGCYYSSGIHAAIEGETPLTCISATGRVVTLKITKENPIVVLDRPHDALLRCTYHNKNHDGDLTNIGQFTVMVTEGTSSDVSSCSPQAGCIEACEEYLPTYEFPDGELGFAPEDKTDPKATVELNSCFGKLVTRIYPKQYKFAQLPIRDCKGSVLGYAIQKPSTHVGEFTCSK